MPTGAFGFAGNDEEIAVGMRMKVWAKVGLYAHQSRGPHAGYIARDNGLRRREAKPIPKPGLGQDCGLQSPA